MQFNNINVNDVNLSGVSTEGQSSIPTGWHKIALTKIGEKTLEKSGAADGALFTFTIADGDDYAGLSFNQWYCVEAHEAKAKWRQNVFNNLVIRIAQCVGVQYLNAVDQLLNIPFYAYVVSTEEEYESKDTDRNGNFIMKKRQNTNFGRGLLTENILSCKEYAEKNQPVELGDMPF